MLYCSINFKQQHLFSISDRGLAYGDGVFTTAKISHGQVELLAQHILRLKKSCQRLDISDVDFCSLEQEVKKAALTFPLAVLKVLITAGQGGRGYSRQGVSKPNVAITVHEFPEHYLAWQTKGISLGDSETYLGLNPLLAGIKHLNRLEQVFVRKELDQREEDDLLVYDINGQLIEASSSNVFWFKGRQLYTTQITDAGIAGLKREQILQCYPDTLQVKVNKAALSDVDAMFLSNSVMGIVPVHRYNQQALSLSPVLALQKKLNQE